MSLTTAASSSTFFTGVASLSCQLSPQRPQSFRLPSLAPISASAAVQEAPAAGSAVPSPQLDSAPSQSKSSSSRKGSSLSSAGAILGPLHKAIVGRRCIVHKTTAAAAAAAWGMTAVERAEARAIAAGATCQLVSSPSGIEWCDSVEGSGEEASKGMMIKAHYTGKLLNGQIFDSSYNRGRPLVFRVGVGEVISGWDQGILGTTGIPAMKAGGKRSLKIPAELAYGARGAGCRGGTCVIPPNSMLVFDVEFLGKA